MVTDTSGTPSVTIVYTPDSTPPSATPTQAPAANAAGWNTTDVTVSWNWADNPGGAGVDPNHCTTSSTSSGEGVQQLSATCADLAGNASTASQTVRVDKTPPTIVAAATTPPTANGWYTANVTVHFTCTDALSGIAAGAYPADQLLSSEGSAVSSTAQTVADVAGNTSAPSNVVTVKLDKTAPVTTLSPGPGATDPGLPLIAVSGSATVKNQAGTTLGTLPFSCWDSQGLTLGLAATDSGSGVASLTYATTGAQASAATTLNGAVAQVTITKHGRTVLTDAATDRAGNLEATHSETLIIGHGFACATPTPSFSLPDAGTLVLSGTATAGGTSSPFNATIPLD